MSVGRGWPSSEKRASVEAQHATIEPTGKEQYGLTVNARVFVYQAGSDAAETGSTTEIIVATAHIAQLGDVVRFTSGSLSGREVKVIAVSANAITVSDELESAPANGDVFLIMRPRYPQVDVDGNLIVSTTPGPTQFVLDSVDTEVEEDTAVPGNSRSLPVRIFRGDGTSTWADDIETALAAANASLDSIEADATTLAAVDFATETTLAGVSVDVSSIDAKVPSQGQALMAASVPVAIASNQSTLPISAASLPLPTGAATETTLAAIETNQTDASQKTQISDSGGTAVAIKTLSTVPLSTDPGLVTQSVIHGLNSGGGGLYVDVKVNPAGKLLVDADVTTLPVAFNTGAASATTQRVVLASDQAAIPTRDPVNTSGSVANTTLTATTASTASVPANAVGFILFADTDNTNTIRFAIGSTASTSVGCKLEPGRDTGYLPCAANVSVCAIVSGTNAFSIQWILSA